ncbi:OLC1v1020324C1 [Oldenlandia corymbosa var. corymbosa]|uniref:OLC1v1020324C1 n=1 Tax=Oldenlandia corymbosa var. corymbosa TaxID=529605 RepID=A0AAV1EGG0_OLDCO|nr:OLC1v1020324C1 [Oldenlandia corymbosa var. corymbosa]
MDQKLEITEICLLNSLPNDTALKIASSLQVAGVCKLSSSSRFWRVICGSDCIWKALYRKRWPAEIGSDHKDSSVHESQSRQANQQLEPSVEEWRKIYRYKHEEMATKAASIINYVEENVWPPDSIELNFINEAAGYMDWEKFGIIDVELLFLRAGVSVLVNSVGLFYCWLYDVMPETEESLLDALEISGISERQVWAKWWVYNQAEGIPREKLVSLKDLAASYRGGKVVDIMRRSVVKGENEITVIVSAVNLSPYPGFAKLQTC